jgi:hypothetical protein
VIGPKLCACGCGQPTPIAEKTDARTGAVKGEPQRYVRGHNTRALRAVRVPLGPPTTGDTLGDDLLPAALQLIDAVHRRDLPAQYDAVTAAYQAADGAQYWVFAFVRCIAALVPEDRRLSELLAWTQTGSGPDWSAPIVTPPSGQLPVRASPRKETAA